MSLASAGTISCIHLDKNHWQQRQKIFMKILRVLYLLRLATVNPRSKASLQTCDPTNPLPPNTSNWIKFHSRQSQESTRIHTTWLMDYEIHSNLHPQCNTFSVGGGGTSTVSASSTLDVLSTSNGSSTLVESVVIYLPFPDTAIVLY